MGEVAVLRPQDLFSNHHHNNLISPALKSQSLGRRYSNPSPTATHTANKHRSSSSNRRKRSPPKKNEIKPRVIPRPWPTPTPSSDNNNNNNNSLVMGQVKLLKRGEALPQPLSAAPAPAPAPSPSPPSKDDNKVVPMMKKQQLQKSNRVPGDKKKVGALSSADGMGPPKQIRFADCYAGSAFVSSPPPSSLPLPAFFKKKNIVFGDVNTGSGNEDNATSDLLRLLRLDLS